MSRLRSPHVVHVYGAVTSRRDRLVLVMELMSGGDLRAFLNGAQAAIPERNIRHIVGDVCAGMTFLHDKLTVHGDLKSSNVLFDECGRAKVSIWVPVYAAETERVIKPFLMVVKMNIWCPWRFFKA